MKNRLQKYALLAEVISAIAIVISLIFVGLQVKDSNRENRAATIQATLDTEMFFQAEILRYGGIWDKVINGESLSDGEEMRRAIVLYGMVMTLDENRLEQYNSGFLDTESPISESELINLPIYDIWKESPGYMSRSPEFRVLVENLRVQNVDE